MGLLGMNKCLPIALDLGSRTIRMMQFELVGKSFRVLAADSWRYPGSVGSDAAERRNAAVQAVREMLQKGKFKGRQVVTALSCKEIDIKNLRLPKVAAGQLDQAVWAEAAERYDFPLEGNQLHYLNAGDVRSGAETQNEIIMLAATKENIEQHVEMVSDMGLVPEYVEAEPIALFRILERFLRRRSDANTVSVLVEVGQSGTRVIVTRGRDIVFIKAIDIGGAQFTEAVARNVNLGYEEAAELRRRSTLSAGRRHDDKNDADEQAERTSVDWTVRDSLRSEVEALRQEVVLCLRYCSVTFRGLRPQKINLVGGEARDSIFMEVFREQLNMECEAADPLREVDTSSVDLGVRRGEIPTDWALCTGLAIRTVNLSELREEEGDEADRLSA